MWTDLLEAKGDLSTSMFLDVPRGTVSTMHTYGANSNVLLRQEHIY